MTDAGCPTTSALIQAPTADVKVVVVHDYLTQRGGAERVVLSILKAFPAAPVHTSLYLPEGTFPEFAKASVRTLGIDRSTTLRNNHRLALPLLAASFGRHHVDADVVICSSSGWAHGARVSGRKIVYCYSPAHWLYDGKRYLGQQHGLVSRVVAGIRPSLVRWDQRAAASADRYLTSSVAVQTKIKAVYGIEAEILRPPPSLDPEGPQIPVDGLEPGFLLCVSRLLPYKNVDAVVEAFRRLPAQRLVIVGAGPEGARLQALAGPNVTFLSFVPDEQLRGLYGASTAVMAASYEDYGLTPLEGAAFGKPAVVVRKGGFLETVIDGQTGLFFDEPDPGLIAQATSEAICTTWSTADLKAHALSFGEESFARRLKELVADEATRT